MDKKETEEKKEEKTSAEASQQENKQEDKKQSETPKKDEGTSEKTEESSASDDEKKQPELDYKSELERLQKQLSQAEHTIEQTKKENKDLKRQASGSEEEEEEEGLEEKVDRKKLSEEIKAEVKAEILADTILDGLTTNSDERALIVFHYKNSIKHSGTSKEAIQADLETAQVLANRNRILKENEELKISLKNREGLSKGTQGTNQDKKQVVITDEDRRIADRHFGGDVNRYLKYKQQET